MSAKKGTTKGAREGSASQVKDDPRAFAYHLAEARRLIGLAA